MIQFGDIEVSRVVESEDPLLSPFEIFPDFTQSVLEGGTPWLGRRFYDPASKLLVITIQSFLIRMPGLTMLVDTCVGDCKTRVRGEFDKASWNWLAKLASAGVRPEDVDVVVCSHLHVDHVGWNTRLMDGRWVPTFPNARYLISRTELAYWQSETGRAALARTGDYVEDSVSPVLEAGQAELVGDGHRINDNIWLESIPGHTPGQVAVHVSDGKDHVILCADLMHHPLQLQNPHWSTLYCADAEQARTTRRRFLCEHAGSNTIVVPAHFPGPTAGNVIARGEHFGFRFIGEDDAIG